MPPKPKYSREEIAAQAFALIKEQGVSALTARELGRRLGTSARPIFTAYENMEEVKLAARKLALAEFNEYISDFADYTPAFKRIGMMVVSYGIHEPELFKLLFMQQHHEKKGFEATLEDLGGNAEMCIRLIERDYALDHSQARFLFEQMWTHGLGLGALCALGICDLSEQEIGYRQGAVFMSLISFIRSGGDKKVYAEAQKGSSSMFHGMSVRDFS